MRKHKPCGGAKTMQKMPCGMAASEKPKKQCRVMQSADLSEKPYRGKSHTTVTRKAIAREKRYPRYAKTHIAGKTIPPLGEKPQRGKSNTPVTRKPIAREKRYPRYAKRGEKKKRKRRVCSRAALLPTFSVNFQALDSEKLSFLTDLTYSF